MPVVVFSAPSAGTSLFWCALVVGAGTGFVGGKYGGSLGESLGEVIYKAKGMIR